MTKQVKIIHIIGSAIAWGILVYSLIHLLMTYQSLADEIGVHFGGNGEFDVIDSKRYIAYPYIVSLICLVVCEGFAVISQKIKMGFKISGIGEKKIREAFIILMDIFKLSITFFFAGVWADCVMRQRYLNTGIPSIILLLLFVSFIAFFGFCIIVKLRDSRVAD